jgi:hypothetical protein
MRRPRYVLVLRHLGRTGIGLATCFVASVFAGLLLFSHSAWMGVLSVVFIMAGWLGADVIEVSGTPDADGFEPWIALVALSYLVLMGTGVLAVGPVYHAWQGRPTTAVVIEGSSESLRSWQFQDVRVSDADTGEDLGEVQFDGRFLHAGDRVQVSIDPRGWLRPMAIYPRPVMRWLHITAAGLAFVGLLVAIQIRLRRRPNLGRSPEVQPPRSTKDAHASP